MKPELNDIEASQDFGMLARLGHDCGLSSAEASGTQVAVEIEVTCRFCGSAFLFENPAWRSGSGSARWRLNSISLDALGETCLEKRAFKSASMRRLSSMQSAGT